MFCYEPKDLTNPDGRTTSVQGAWEPFTNQLPQVPGFGLPLPTNNLQLITALKNEIESWEIRLKDFLSTGKVWVQVNESNVDWAVRVDLRGISKTAFEMFQKIGNGVTLICKKILKTVEEAESNYQGDTVIAEWCKRGGPCDYVLLFAKYSSPEVSPNLLRYYIRQLTKKIFLQCHDRYVIRYRSSPPLFPLLTKSSYLYQNMALEDLEKWCEDPKNRVALNKFRESQLTERLGDESTKAIQRLTPYEKFPGEIVAHLKDQQSKAAWRNGPPQAEKRRRRTVSMWSVQKREDLSLRQRKRLLAAIGDEEN